MNSFRLFLESHQQIHVFCDMDETLMKNVSAHAMTRIFLTSIDPLHSSLPIKEKIAKGRELYGEMENPELMEIARKLGVKIIEIDGKTIASILRPFASKFLDELSTFAEVAILTSGGTQYQNHFMKAHGLNFPLFGGDRYSAVPKSQASILLDDLWFTTSGVQQKLQAIGVTGEEHFIQVPGFDGSINDTVLADLAGKVKQHALHYFKI